MTDARLVVFDVDGTLIDSQHVILAAMHGAFTAAGHPLPLREEVLGIVGLSLPEAVVRFRQGVGRLIRSRRDRGLACWSSSTRCLKHSHLFQAADPCGSAAPVLSSDPLAPASRFLRDRLPGGRSYVPSTGV